tara:strand:+ start:2456 stop:2692 length:237 start_codon:yes stop_codon:yes gene_type:complete
MALRKRLVSNGKNTDFYLGKKFRAAGQEGNVVYRISAVTDKHSYKVTWTIKGVVTNTVFTKETVIDMFKEEIWILIKQ